MKKRIAIILAIILMLTLCIVFCSCEDNSNSDNSDRLIKVDEWKQDGICYTTYYDKETKVMYLSSRTVYSGGLTIMLDENGKPLLYEEETE